MVLKINYLKSLIRFKKIIGNTEKIEPIESQLEELLDELNNTLRLK